MATKLILSVLLCLRPQLFANPGVHESSRSVIHGMAVVSAFQPMSSFSKLSPSRYSTETVWGRIFPTTIPGSSTSTTTTTTTTTALFAQISQAEAQKAIDKVVQALRKDKVANEELGKLQKVTTVLGFGSPSQDTVAVRFNASFSKSGFGRSAVPLPFGLGQSNESEGRGAMVGQVKASISSSTGKILSVSVFRDLGYGRSFNLKV